MEAETSGKKAGVKYRWCGKARVPAAPGDLRQGGVGMTMAAVLSALPWC